MLCVLINPSDLLVDVMMGSLMYRIKAPKDLDENAENVSHLRYLSTFTIESPFGMCTKYQFVICQNHRFCRTILTGF